MLAQEKIDVHTQMYSYISNICMNGSASLKHMYKKSTSEFRKIKKL